jgi:protein-S-isoprenylcysteine O-methyltransferase Ste14
MNIKGLTPLQEHVPELNTRSGILRGPLAVGAVFVLTTLFFLAADRGFPEWMPDGEIVVLALGFLILSRFFSQRRRYQAKYGALAYRNAFARFGIPGLGIVSASIGHLAYIAGPDIPDLWWKPWLVALGTILVAVGFLLWFRAVTSSGIDGLVMLYVYYPEEGTMFGSGLYSILRHPIYSAALDIGFGLALVHANWYALLVALLLPIFFAGWVRLIEEPDLLQRFPQYAAYRSHVPAFAPAPANLMKFLRCLLTGES